MKIKNRTYILKAALFATGLSGIVAEYILATLATYFLGNSVLQWTLIISHMLFFMGIGSRITQVLTKHIFTYFVGIEFALSLVVSFSALITYSVAAFSAYTGVFIYGLAILTGTMIGMELPLAVRLNEQYEELRINVSSILEKDYYGSLLGGLFFAFVGLPYLGLTYTPFILGAINLLVAISLLQLFPSSISKKRINQLRVIAVGVLLVIGLGAFSAQKIIFFGEQQKYVDKVIYSEQTAYQKIVITQWKDDYWLYLDGNLQFSSFDEPLYHEVLVHPAVQLTPTLSNVLILGGGDGCAARELLKYQSVQSITLVDLDPAMTRLASEHPVLLEMNNGALKNPKVTVFNQDGFTWLEQANRFFDLIIIDLPDPRSVELSRLYSFEFYQMCKKHLRPGGVLITQAGSPYFAPRSFRCIEKTMEATGLSVIPLHNQIITMGEWGWMLGVKQEIADSTLIHKLKKSTFEEVDTRWINQEALNLITSFGKDYFKQPTDTVRVNKIHDPVLYRYFLNGTWDLY